jgi:hypothetical protein
MKKERKTGKGRKNQMYWTVFLRYSLALFSFCPLISHRIHKMNGKIAGACYHTHAEGCHLWQWLHDKGDCSFRTRAGD